MFDSIKNHFHFLEKNYAFEIIKEESKLIHLSAGLCYIVHYKNKYTYIEVGAFNLNHVYLEIRKFNNGKLANYGDEVYNINTKTLKKLLFNDEESLKLTFPLESLSKTIKEQIHYFISNFWFDSEKIKSINSTFHWKYATLEEIILKNSNFLESKGYTFYKSNNTLSSFDATEFEGPFYEFKNGENIIRIEYVMDVREQYFCFHLVFNQKLTKGIFNQKDIINLITEELKKII